MTHAMLPLDAAGILGDGVSTLSAVCSFKENGAAIFLKGCPGKDIMSIQDFSLSITILIATKINIQNTSIDQLL